MTVYECWQIKQKLNLSDKQYKELLIEKGIININTGKNAIQKKTNNN